MQAALSLFSNVFGGGAAAAGATGAAGAAGAAAGAAGAASGIASAGSTIASILQGTASLLGVMQMNSAAEVEATSLDLAAADAEAEKALENLQGIGRNTEINRSLKDAIGSQDVAYGASGVDLTFGTPGRARTEAFREADVGLTTSANTASSRMARLDERAANYRARAASTRSSARQRGAMGLLGTGADILLRG